ncbi:hypothetical protein BD311DRAFT_753345 [Dichomitus squalens]|uniref:Uncharacterized protein n=1 Tax=Dichomitus squalens TaxID=114155 RepID=A0A4Q9MTZ8_9APHY|nr:hypothetical protein BD311DRAFT_753345 [Dichomitus squalens]
MAFADFLKAAFGFVFGYDLDAARKSYDEVLSPPFLTINIVFFLEEERKRPQSLLDYVPCDDSLDCFAFPPPHLPLSGPSPSHTFAGWQHRRFGVV